MPSQLTPIYRHPDRDSVTAGRVLKSFPVFRLPTRSLPIIDVGQRGRGRDRGTYSRCASRVNFESCSYFKFWRERNVRASARITWACPSVNKIYQRKRFSETFSPTSKTGAWPSAVASNPRRRGCFSIGNISLRRTLGDIRNSQCILSSHSLYQREVTFAFCAGWADGGFRFVAKE